MAHVQIFLSTVSAEFRSYRDALRRDLDQPNVTVKVQEDFIATGTETLDKLDEYIRQCDAVIHLVGDMTGALAQAPSLAAIQQRYPDLGERLPVLEPILKADAPLLSYTHWEAWLALYHRKVLIIAAPEDGAPRDERYQRNEVQRGAQQAHLARLASVERYPEIRFLNADRLAVDVLRSKLLGILLDKSLGRIPDGSDATSIPLAHTVGAIQIERNYSGGLSDEDIRRVVGETLAVESPRQAQVERLSQELSIRDAAVANFFQTLEVKGVPTDQWAVAFADIARSHLRLRDEVRVLRTDTPEITELRNVAAAALNEDDTLGAELALTTARDQVRATRERLADVLAARALEEGELEGALGDVAMTHLEYLRASEQYAQAAELVPAAYPDLKLKYLFRRALALHQQGEDHFDAAALRQSIETWRRILEENLVGSRSRDWATIQNNIGIALTRLGEREGNSKYLKAGVDVFRDALAEQEAGTASTELQAMTLSNLAIALWEIGRRESDNECLEEAVSTLREAIRIYPVDQVNNRATAEFNLGVLLTDLGWREDTTARLEEAVSVCRASLEEWPRESAPRLWTYGQLHLGSALHRLGERENGTSRLEEAAQALRRALEGLKKETHPVQWIQAQMGLGQVLLTWGKREKGVVCLEEAQTAFRTALEVIPRDEAPAIWATTQSNLADTLRVIGERESGTTRLEEAAAACREALKERTPNTFQWALSQNVLGATLLALGLRKTGPARAEVLSEAVQAVRSALTVWKRDTAPFQWGLAQQNLGLVLLGLTRENPDAPLLKEAVDATGQALKVLKLETNPLTWAQAQYTLGEGLTMLYRLEANRGGLAKAIQAFRDATRVWKRDTMPGEWAATYASLGTALLMLAEGEGNPTYFEEAIAAIRRALDETTEEEAPFVNRAAAQSNLGRALARLGVLISDSAILEEAVQVIRRALAKSAVTESHFNAVHAYVELARTLFELGVRSENLDRLIEAQQLTAMVRSWYQEARAPQHDSYFVDQLAKIEPAMARLSAKRQAALDLGVSLEKQNRPGEAEAVYRKGMELGDGFLASCLGSFLGKQGRDEEAEVAYRKALALGFKRAYHNLGLLFARQDRTEEAIGVFHQGLDFGYGEAGHDLGIELTKQGRIAEAEVAYRKALELGYGRAANNLGILVENQGQLKEAEATYRQGLEFGCSDAAYNLGVLLQKQSRNKEAEAAYRKALELGFGGAAASNLGVLLDGEGRFEEAEDAYRKAVELTKDSRLAIQLGTFFEQRNRLQEAESAYCKAAGLGDPLAALYLYQLLVTQDRTDK